MIFRFTHHQNPQKNKHSLSKIQFTALLMASLVLTMPMTQQFAAEKGHWAAPLAEKLQKDSLFQTLKTDSKTLSLKLTGNQLSAMTAELAEKYKKKLAKSQVTQLKSITRQQAAKELYAQWKDVLPKKVAATKTTPFKDVHSKDPALATAIEWTVQQGLFKGYADNTFKPEQPMTLGEGVAIMHQLNTVLASESVAAIGNKEAALLKEVSYHWQPESDGNYSLIVSWGEKPTGGYSIRVDSFEYLNNEAQVYLTLKAPLPEDMVTQAFTYPKATQKTTLKKADVERVKVILRLTPTTPATF